MASELFLKKTCEPDVLRSMKPTARSNASRSSKAQFFRSSGPAGRGAKLSLTRSPASQENGTIYGIILQAPAEPKPGEAWTGRYRVGPRTGEPAANRILPWSADDGSFVCDRHPTDVPPRRHRPHAAVRRPARRLRLHVERGERSPKRAERR